MSPRTTIHAATLRGLATALLICACSDGDPAAKTAKAGQDAPAESATPEDPLAEFSGVMSPAEFKALRGPRGLRVRAEGAFEGYTLVMPLVSTKVHLIDLAGDVAHTWETGYAPGGWCYLLDDGSLLHAGRQDKEPKFRGGGIGGIIRRLAPNGDVLWRFDFANDAHCQHHDLEPLPNGNFLFIAWESISAEAARALGRRPDAVGAAGLWPDAVFELRPTPPEGGELVWSWHAKDHLVQDVDPTLPNYGAIADFPQRIDINFDYVPPSKVTDEERLAEADRKKQMAAFGYGGGDEDEEDVDAADARPADPKLNKWEKSGDWLHTNAVDYNAEHDLIVLSSPDLSQIFVIDHSTTTSEAAGSTGGRFGQGGDLLWRWGNPEFEGRGTPADQQLFYQHDPTWLASTKPDELRLLVFNNGGERPDGKNRSEVLELLLPFTPKAGFAREAGRPQGPLLPAWKYEDAPTFFSAFISGARRLPNGNTIVCSGAPGRIFEVTPAGAIVWDYANPFGGDFKSPDHAGNAPPLALYRADRYAPTHPGIVALMRLKQPADGR